MRPPAFEEGTDTLPSMMQIMSEDSKTIRTWHPCSHILDLLVRLEGGALAILGLDRLGEAEGCVKGNCSLHKAADKVH